MHINSHFSLGIIFASILNNFFNFTLFEFLLIVLFSFICDFDVFFSKYAKDHNHRMLISHSIIPSLFIVACGFITNWPALLFSGISYIIHIIIDTFDWGTNFLYFQKKQIGLKLLISKEELENLPKYLSKYKRAESFFVLMMVFIIIYALQYIFLIFIYFIFLCFHLYRHFILKRIESSD
jgi:hypothetical protein